MNTEPRTRTANGSAIIRATLSTASPTSPASARHSAEVAGVASLSFFRHFRFHSFCASRLSFASRTATVSMIEMYGSLSIWASLPWLPEGGIQARLERKGESDGHHPKGGLLLRHRARQAGRRSADLRRVARCGCEPAGSPCLPKRAEIADRRRAGRCGGISHGREECRTQTVEAQDGLPDRR